MTQSSIGLTQCSASLPKLGAPDKGGITQLVEWLLCKQHVAGSNPATSTNDMGL